MIIWNQYCSGKGINWSKDKMVFELIKLRFQELGFLIFVMFCIMLRYFLKGVQNWCLIIQNSKSTWIFSFCVFNTLPLCCDSLMMIVIVNIFRYLFIKGERMGGWMDGIRVMWFHALLNTWLMIMMDFLSFYVLS